ncbi:lipopolysaccharide biosynthesis protein [Aliivibrio sifiae]|uniref:lipopolysaccharide biosynthesis protein n=1 Tax=Aliivibrio sifiae TaxID=566293 RepID=UPI003D0B2E49
MKKLNKDFVILTLGKILQVAIALLSVRLLTSLLSTTEVGNYYLLITILTLLNFTFLNPIGQYYNRHIIPWRLSKNLSNASLVLVFTRFFGVLCSLIISTVVFYVFDYEVYYSLCEFLLFIFVSLMASSFLVYLNVINILGNRVLFIKYLLVSLILGLSFSLLITEFIDKSGMAWLYGIAIAQLLLFIPVYKKVTAGERTVYSKLKAKLDYLTIKKVFVFSLPVTITLFLQWGQNSSYRIIVEDKYSIEVLAYVAVGLSVATAIYSAVESLATQYFMPIYLRDINNATQKERAEAWNKLAAYVLPIYFLLMSYTIFTAPFLMKVLINEKFHGAYIYLMIGASIEFFRVSSNVFYLISQSEVKTKSTITPYLIGFSFVVVALYFVNAKEYLWLIPSILSFSYLLIATILFINMKKLLSIKLPVLQILKATVLSLPFISLLIIDGNQNIIGSLTIIGISGVYFLFASHFLFTNSMKKNTYNIT